MCPALSTVNHWTFLFLKDFLHKLNFSLLFKKHKNSFIIKFLCNLLMMAVTCVNLTIITGEVVMVCGDVKVLNSNWCFIHTSMWRVAWFSREGEWVVRWATLSNTKTKRQCGRFNFKRSEGKFLYITNSSGLIISWYLRRGFFHFTSFYFLYFHFTSFHFTLFYK